MVSRVFWPTVKRRRRRVYRNHDVSFGAIAVCVVCVVVSLALSV